MKGNFEKFRNYIFFGKCMKVNEIFSGKRRRCRKKGWGMLGNLQESSS